MSGSFEFEKYVLLNITLYSLESMIGTATVLRESSASMVMREFFMIILNIVKKRLVPLSELLVKLQIFK
ncbi:hypothetical protein PLUTE_a3573 [Pseudoalteromonas luteoviolacea DSM 6061]|nr:hypothetical protein [Pseudoalteromonas luteoviolacea DSM 6061]